MELGYYLVERIGPSFLRKPWVDFIKKFQKKILQVFSGFIYIIKLCENEFVETVYQMKAWQMAYKYQSIFSRLAKEYRVSIVAGSIVLPNPKVIEGNITPTDGPLRNVSFYFHSDGRVDEKMSNWHSESYFFNEEKPFPTFAKRKFGEGKILCFFY